VSASWNAGFIVLTDSAEKFDSERGEYVEEEEEEQAEVADFR